MCKKYRKSSLNILLDRKTLEVNISDLKNIKYFVFIKIVIILILEKCTQFSYASESEENGKALCESDEYIEQT